MKPPKVTKSLFPPAWRRWRKVKVGEALRANDRVLGTFIIRHGRIVRRAYSVRLMKEFAGATVNRPNRGNPFPYGWYYRRVK